MQDTILEKDTISVVIGDDHSFNCTAVTIGRTGENSVTQLEITIPQELNTFWAYLDFKKPRGETVKTGTLAIENNKLEYDIPNGLLDQNGNLEVQLVLQNENGEVWKSATKKFVVLKSIDASDDIPEMEDFVTEVQQRLNDTVSLTYADATYSKITQTDLLEKTIDDTKTELTTHESANNPHGITKNEIGLENVDNTADSAKSVKYATSAGSATTATHTANAEKLGGVVASDYALKTDIPTSMTPTAHNQASNTINVMTGYSKPSSTSAINVSDSLNVAIGKIEKALDSKQASGSYSTTGHKHTKSEITDFPALATVATSGNYNDLTNKPTIPTVNNGTLTIQKNGTNVQTFTANQISNVTANITVPTKVSELTNDSGYKTNVAWSEVSNKPSYYDAKSIKSVTRNGTTFTYTCMDGTTGTFTQQDNDTVYTHPAYTAKSSGLYKVTVDSTGHISATTTASKSDIGLGNVDNTADSAKSVKYATSAGSTSSVKSPSGYLSFDLSSDTNAKFTGVTGTNGFYFYTNGDTTNPMMQVGNSEVIVKKLTVTEPWTLAGSYNTEDGKAWNTEISYPTTAKELKVCCYVSNGVYTCIQKDILLEPIGTGTWYFHDYKYEAYDTYAYTNFSVNNYGRKVKLTNYYCLFENASMSYSYIKLYVYYR